MFAQVSLLVLALLTAIILFRSAMTMKSERPAMAIVKVRPGRRASAPTRARGGRI